MLKSVCIFHLFEGLEKFEMKPPILHYLFYYFLDFSVSQNDLVC